MTAEPPPESAATGDDRPLPPGLKLNLGCGPVQPEGWVNCDGSNRAWLASKFRALDRFLVRFGIIPPTEFGPQIKWLNLSGPLPWAEGSVSCIYAGEVWEHFEYDDALRLTRECHRVLAPGGVLRLCVPDGKQFWGKYLELLDGEMAKPRSERDAGRLRDHVQMFFNEICTRKVRLGFMGHFHKWQFDEVQLVELFESCGFQEVERMKYHQSRIPGVEQIERSDFLIVEGVKGVRSGE